MDNSIATTSRALLENGGRSCSMRVRLLAIALLAVLVSGTMIAVPAPAFAVRKDTKAFQDADTNPLRVVSYVLYPVGSLLEWVVFRPLHFIASPLAPRRSNADPAAQGCRRERPARNCGHLVK